MSRLYKNQDKQQEFVQHISGYLTGEQTVSRDQDPFLTNSSFAEDFIRVMDSAFNQEEAKEYEQFIKDLEEDPEFKTIDGQQFLTELANDPGYKDPHAKDMQHTGSQKLKPILKDTTKPNRSAGQAKKTVRFAVDKVKPQQPGL